jgi:hypothetical protein
MSSPSGAACRNPYPIDGELRGSIRRFFSTHHYLRPNTSLLFTKLHNT